MRMPSGTRRRAVLGWGVLSLALVGAAPHVRSDGPPTRHVLFLNSYRQGLEWSDDLVRGMQTALEEQPYPITFSVEHMDSGRFSGPTYEAQLQDLLRFKYAGRPIDAIVAADDEALTFLLAHRTELFPHVPVVFLGINNAELVSRADPDSYTGLGEELRTGDIVDLATTLRPARPPFMAG